MTQNAMAQADLGFKAVGVEGGFVSPENIDGTVGFGLFTNMGSLTPNIGLSTNLGYWSKSWGVSGIGETSVRDISVMTRATYYFHTSTARFTPYAGVGLGIHVLQSKVELAEQDLGGGIVIPGMSLEDTMTKLGVDLGAGFKTPITPSANLVTGVWYGLVSDVNQMSMKLGVEFALPN